MKRLYPLVLIAACLIAVPACDGEPADPDQLSIVVSTSILGDVVENVIDGAATVEVLIPVGSDSHDYSASSAQVAAMHRADLVILNGLGLEEGMTDLVEGLVADGIEVFEIGPLLNPIQLEGSQNPDPHVWMDPLRMAEGARLIGLELTRIAPDRDWMASAEAYAVELQEVDDEIVNTLAVVPEAQRVMVTNHESFGYFADRYVFDVIGTVIPGGSTLEAPSSAELAELVAVMRETNTTVIFGETTRPDILAEAVARELSDDVEVVDLYTESLGAAGSDADTYIGMLRVNAQLVAGSLS
ncbi:MAG TPA: metal ABC transporter substrate-binding protein [Acidimicrobiia bacterium]